MKKILVTGGNGQLGQCFQKLAPDFPEFEFIFRDSQNLDITNQIQIEEFFQVFKPDFCINGAAYTAVDLAETEKDKAFEINSVAVSNLAKVSADYKTALVQISTDYVFDGDTNLSYDEEDFTNPQSIYGESKREGEIAALEENPKTVVIRTSWLYSEFNKNFMKTMLNLFPQKEEMNIVNDQFGQPTNANDLAEAVMKIIKSENFTPGIFHFSNYPETTWFHFAQKIADFSQSKIKLNPITTSEFPTPAKRPKRSTMCLDKIEKIYKVELQHWENSLEDTVKNYLAK
ncbi:dTDP-4-dehydrorhamnose reductase [Halpernia frigidisoli]|uniref:dTDP-4-dehydrorhamnose reductase n=1 Tax=Halpernia frigidisoli TaxID=1125876 RepID=A0A1I3I7K4_9FLAO|nr:dTDP-4-dehydrorhamnose reductase [Halpernia frigidisoli]SFI43911.1 dTDP-4-dehydrorhamnose reductase [Halpernia frigidisoli]